MSVGCLECSCFKVQFGLFVHWNQVDLFLLVNVQRSIIKVATYQINVCYSNRIKLSYKLTIIMNIIVRFTAV